MFAGGVRRRWPSKSSRRDAKAHDRDYRVEREEYLAYGLAEYWIVDPDERRIVVFLRDGGTWVEQAFSKPEESASGLGTAGVPAPLAELWRVVDEDAALP